MHNVRDISPLVVRELDKSYGRTPVLRQLNLELSPGTVHGLVGLNGSGKTTTLECVLGMLPFDGGSIRVLDHRPDQLWRARGKVVGIFDTPSLHPGLTVEQTLVHAGLLCPRPVRSPAEVCELLGISRYRQYRIRHLSLGNRRRASIAQALIGEPAFVILDEPFNGLDAGGVDDMLALVSRLNREQGTAFLLSSHQLPYLERICSHMTILHRGRIASSGHVDTLFARGSTRLRLRCDREQEASRLLATLPGLTVQHVAPGSLSVELDETSASEVNRQLVNAGFAVSELLTEKTSLDSLFRDITSDAEPVDEDAA